MIAKQKRAWHLVHFVASLLTPFLMIAGCAGTPPQSTFTLKARPGTEVQVGQSVAIVAVVEPLEKLDLKWSIYGTAEGELNTDTGEQIIYTARKEGEDLVVAEGTTASGAPVKQTILIVVGTEALAPGVTPVPPTATLVPPTATSLSPLEATPSVVPSLVCPSFRPPLRGAADFAGEVEIITPSNCTTGLPTENPIPVAGTYEGIPNSVDIWMLVYPPNMVYYIQSPSACDGAKMAQAGGNWQVPVYLGAKGGGPEWFDIVVVLADQEASQFFSSSVKQMCQSRRYYGIPAAQLEQMNITEKNYITVQTLD
jgi:hypothetical protein